MVAAIVALSCGILVFDGAGELLLCHATGTARWDIPKGLAERGETPRQAALRETEEETGLVLPADALLEIGRFAYRRGKDLHLFAALIERVDASTLRCRTRFVDARGRSLVEMDRFEWVALAEAPQRCAKRMAALLGGPIALAPLWQRLRESPPTAARVRS